MDSSRNVEDSIDADPVYDDYYTASASTSNIPSSQQLASHQARSEQIIQYNMNHSRRGKLIVICNSKFDDKLKLPERKWEGCEKDLKALENTFCNELKFEGTFLVNQTVQQMFKVLANEGVADHTDCDCLALVVLTHGKQMGQLYGTNDHISVDKLVEPLKTNETLVGKPKLIFIQACRGGKKDHGVRISSDSGSEKGIKPAMTIPIEADFLYAFSTAEGYPAFNNPEQGSWFMQELCAELALNWKSHEIVQMLTRVCHRIAYERISYTPSEPETHNLKQVSSVTTTLTKALYFSQQ